MIDRHPAALLSSVLLFACGCARATVARPEVAKGELFRGPSVDEVEVAPGTDWGHSLFPSLPAVPAPTPVATPAPEPVPADAKPEPFAPSEYFAESFEPDTIYADLPAFCAAVLADEPGDEQAAAPRSCAELPLEVPFHPDATYLAARAVRIQRSGYAYSTLLVRVKTGLVPMPLLSWDAVDPNDPGCPSIVRDVGLEELRIENGILVAVALGENMTYVEVPPDSNDSGARTQLVREIAMLKSDDTGLHARKLGGFSGPPLGHKLQPKADAFVAWRALPWKEHPSFKIAADGTLAIGK